MDSPNLSLDVTGSLEEQKNRPLASIWQSMYSKKSAINAKSQEYAKWTLPYLFDTITSPDTEKAGPLDSTGPRAVNHLSNKLITTLFPLNGPFFRMRINQDFYFELQDAAESGDDEAGALLKQIDKKLTQAEKSAMQRMNYTRYRTEATTAAKNLIVLGNALLYRPVGGGKVQCYNFNDWCVSRDVQGNVVSLITRDTKALYTFGKHIRDQLSELPKFKNKKANGNVTIYTYVYMNEDGKYEMRQDAEDIKLDSSGTFTAATLPWTVLTWNLLRGEDYGRGLVEDYAGCFHALYVLTEASTNLIAIAADIKFLVSPESLCDVAKINSSRPGTYHTGKEGDISTITLDKNADMALVSAMIERLERQIAAAFLLNSATTRDAERVTAEEIRMIANDLELSHGGIYSRFAEEWQLKEAMLLMKDVNINVGNDNMVVPEIITGLDSLSRAGDLDNLRLWAQDLQLLQALPEQILMAIDAFGYAAYTGSRRGVEYTQILKSSQQMQAEQIQRQQEQQAALQGEAAMSVAAEAGKAMVNG